MARPVRPASTNHSAPHRAGHWELTQPKTLTPIRNSPVSCNPAAARWTWVMKGHVLDQCKLAGCSSAGHAIRGSFTLAGSPHPSVFRDRFSTLVLPFERKVDAGPPGTQVGSIVSTLNSPALTDLPEKPSHLGAHLLRQCV